MDVHWGKICGREHVLTRQHENQRIFLKEQLIVILSRLKRLIGTSVSVLRTRCVHWTTQLTSSLPLGTLADLTRSKAERVRGKCALTTTTDHPQAAGETACMHEDGSVAPRPFGKGGSGMETSAHHRSTRHTAAVASWALPPVLEAQVKGLFTQAQGSRGNHRVDQRDGEGESASSVLRGFAGND
jgi:hypothetical protein